MLHCILQSQKLDSMVHAHNNINEGSDVERWMYKLKLASPFHRVLGTYAHRLQNSKNSSEAPLGVTKWFIPFVLHRVLRILPTCKSYRNLLIARVIAYRRCCWVERSLFFFFRSSHTFWTFFGLLRRFRPSRLVEVGGNVGRRPILASLGYLCRPMW